jgi:hypothetical protein
VRYRQHGSNMSRDAALMLRTVLGVLRHERAFVGGVHLKAFRTGWTAWMDFYGEQIVERLRYERRAGVRTPWQSGAVWTLVRYCPSVVMRHTTRKAWRLLRGLPAEDLDSARFGRGGLPPLTAEQ